ncbi:MAG TPA: CAP domain-containing protein [Polyangia bacterium]|nr:CAP domain-containing protein [Polyangia bacterium]
MRNLVVVLLAMSVIGCGGSSGKTLSTADSHVQHNLATLNMYRAQNGIAALTLDDQLMTFSADAVAAYEASGTAHAYFGAQGSKLWTEGFCSGAGENQAPDWPITGGDEDATIDAILAAMFGEGPTGGHYQNIMNAAYTRVGVGLIVTAKNGLWLSNDFSNACN